MGTNQPNSDIAIGGFKQSDIFREVQYRSRDTIELTNVGEELKVEILAQKLIERIRFVDTEEPWESLLFTHGTEFKRDAEKLRSRGFGAGVRLTSNIILVLIYPYSSLASSPSYRCCLYQLIRHSGIENR